MESFLNPDSTLSSHLKKCREVMAAYKIGSREIHKKLRDAGVTREDTSFTELTEMFLHGDLKPELLEELHGIATLELAKTLERTRADVLHKIQPRP